MGRLGDWKMPEGWSIEEDYAIECICEACGHYNAEEGCCEECGSEDILVETAHEGIECSHCGCPFGIWEDYFVHEDGRQICKYCYNELTEDQ